MAEFIGPVIDAVVAVLERYTPGLVGTRDPFVEILRQWTGVVQNFPSCYVMPVGTTFNPDAERVRHEAHQITIKFAVDAAEPAEVTAAAMAYMAAIDGAIQAAVRDEWPETVSRVWVQEHDYGALYERSGAFARFPELALVVEGFEV